MIASILFINDSISEMNIFIGILEIIFGMLIYFLIMFLIKGINKNDFFIFKNYKLGNHS